LKILIDNVWRICYYNQALTREAINAAIRRSEYFAESEITILIKPDFFEAVETAKNLAADGDVVVLSPACASFDAFRNFEERGTIFKNIINTMAEKGNN